ncbi:MAG: ketopantoate reductase family protein [Clostridia bacterium]|nr:ketopantoate reductase family protein [Clostridia bacterium]
MKTILIGPGSIGGTTATLIKKAGYDITVVTIDQQTADQISNVGYKLTGALGEHLVKIPAIAGIDKVTEKYDICIISTKVFSMPKLAELMLPHLKDDSIVMCMQNGIVVDRLAAVVGKNRTVGCMIGFGATAKSLTEVNVTSGGEFYIGMADGSRNEKLEYLQKMLSSVLPTKIEDDIVARLFSKLIINSCINSCCGMAGQTLGTLLADRTARDLFLAIALEATHLSKAMGLKVPPYNGILDYNLLLVSKAAAWKAIMRGAFWGIGKLKYSDVKPSLLQALERGEKTEIDIFNGYISEKAKEYGIETPVNDLVVKLIREIEEDKRPMGIDNIYEFKSLLYK